MYCPSCGNEITVELKYCSRCGANLSLTSASYPAPVATPIKLTAPAVVLGLTITVGLGIIFSGARELADLHLHPAAITWMVIFSLAMLFGCTALLLRFWSKMFSFSREAYPPPQNVRPPAQTHGPQQHLPPRFEPVPSVTEHTTRTFSPAYREGSDRGSR
ncbi:MAG: zinc ribbon domain-containing protein [Pyrinomonadaceae bacterium]